MTTPDKLEIMPGVTAEPEEAPARRVQALPVEISLAPKLPEVESRHGRPALKFPGALPVLRTVQPMTAEMTAGEAADLLRERCFRCSHFRNDLWIATKKVWEGAPIHNSRRQGLIAMVNQLARNMTDSMPSLSDLATAHAALGTWGVCEALSDERKDLVLVHPAACCPDGIDYYRDRDLPAKREASATFDSIMRAAQGRR